MKVFRNSVNQQYVVCRNERAENSSVSPVRRRLRLKLAFLAPLAALVRHEKYFVSLVVCILGIISLL